MSQLEKYIKLGEKATSFFDPDTHWGISGDDIKPILPAQLKSARIKRFISGGALVIVGKEEYKEYLASKEKPVKKAEKEETKTESKKEEKDQPKELSKMTKKELYEYIEKSGWDQEDIDMGLEIELKDEILEFIKTTEADYE